MKTEREMFVKKYREVFKVDKSLFVNDNGEFIDEFCQAVYEIWQSRVPEGYVVVPKEPSTELVNHGHQVFLGHFNEGGQTGGRSLYFAYKAMIGAQESKG